MQSFAQKLTGLVTGPTDIPQDEQIPWYLRYGARGLGIVGAFCKLKLIHLSVAIKISLNRYCFAPFNNATVAILFGFWNCFGVLTISLWSVLSGIIQILVGIQVMAIEAPVCCMFLDHAQKFAQMVESRPYYYRAAAYCL